MPILKPIWVETCTGVASGAENPSPANVRLWRETLRFPLRLRSGICSVWWQFELLTHVTQM